MVSPDEMRKPGRVGCSKRATLHPQAHIDIVWRITSRHIAIKWMFWVTIAMLMVQPVVAPRDSAPNRDDNYHVLQGMSEWNGVPRRDFRRVWFAALVVALGAIFQDGWTLLQTARDEDAGGPGNPGIGANAATAQRQSQNRNHRLFMSILKYIDKLSSVYKMATNHFNHDGRGLFNYLWTFGHKPYTLKQNQKRENVWKDASIMALRIPIDEDTPQVWKEWCVEHGTRLNKTLADIRTKYLEGFPDNFDVVIMPERASLANAGMGNYVLPNVYPAHFPAHLAGNAHPQAGEPDLDTLATYLSTVWIDMMLQDKIKAPPKGSVHEVTIAPSAQNSCVNTGHAINQISGPVGNTPGLSSEEPDFETRSGLFGAFQIVPVLDPDTGTIQNQIFSVKRDSIGPQTLCYVCGGRGHVSRIDGITCSTIELGVQIPRPLLETTTYSDGITFPKFKPRGNPSADGSHSKPRGCGSGPSSSSRSPRRAVVRVATPARRGSPTNKARIREVVPKQAAAAQEEHSSDSEDSKHNAHQVEIAMDFGDIQI